MVTVFSATSIQYRAIATANKQFFTVINIAVYRAVGRGLMITDLEGNVKAAPDCPSK